MLGSSEFLLIKKELSNKKEMLVILVLSVLSTANISSYAMGKIETETSTKATSSSTAITGKGQVILINQDKTLVPLKHDPITAI